MVRLLSVLIFTVSLAVVLSFDCGSDPFQNMIAEAIIKLDCPARLGTFNGCCHAHDQCYAAKRGQEECDNVFCDCVTTAGNINPQCQAHGRNFCGAVRSFGAIAYKGKRK